MKWIEDMSWPKVALIVAAAIVVGLVILSSCTVNVTIQPAETGIGYQTP